MRRPLYLSRAALLLFGLASCHVAAPTPKPVIKPPVAPPVVQPAFLGHLPSLGETLPIGRTNVYAGNMLIGYLMNDGQVFSNPPHAPGDTGIFWTVERDPTGLRHWRATGNTAWVVSQAFGDGAPWRVAP